MSAGRSHALFALLSVATAASVGLTVSSRDDAAEARREAADAKEKAREWHDQVMTFNAYLSGRVADLEAGAVKSKEHRDVPGLAVRGNHRP